MTTDGLHCSHFGRCGGCSRLPQPIDAQLRDKRDLVEARLAPMLDGVRPTFTLPPRTPRHDRTSILYPVQPRRRGGVAGIYRRGTHQVEPIRDCRIQHRALTEFGVRANQVLRDTPALPYDERDGSGDVRAIRARVLPGSNELLVGAVVTSQAFTGRDRLFEGLWRAAHGLRDDQGRPLEAVGAVANIHAEPGNALLGERSYAVHGRDWQQHEVDGLTFRVSFGSFYQLHRHAEAVLFRPALAMLGDGLDGLRIVDGYGGVGTFALRLLRAGAAHVTLIESSPSACADARHNLAVNGFDDRAEVREQRFGTEPLPPADLLLLDPPRAGLQADGAAAVLAAAPPRVLLVSCSLDGLARDLEHLTAAYRVEALQLCDMFPHTDHIELVTLLRPR